MINNKQVEEIKKFKELTPPTWSSFVKTGVSKERPPENPDWWHIRAISILRKVRKYGPIGSSRLSKFYGGNKNMGMKPQRKADGSRNIIRKILIGLKKEGLIKVNENGKAGCIISKEGNDFIKKLKSMEDNN